MLFKKIFIVIMIVASGSVVNAQKLPNKKDMDYLITASGDTVFCKISFSFFNNSKARYKTAEMKSAVAIDPNQIAAYYDAKKKELYTSILLPDEDESQFLQVVEDGPIRIYKFLKNVYSAYSYGGSSIIIWFMSKNNGKLEQIKTNSFLTGMDISSRKEREDVFGELLKDKPEVYTKYADSKKFSFDRIRSLVHLYNTGVWVDDWTGN